MLNDGECYRVRQWEAHELAATRKLKRLPWLPVPVKLDGDGYTELIMDPEGTTVGTGAAHYGCWMAILLVAARCEPRGYLLRSSGDAHTPNTLSRMTRISATVLGAAIERLLSVGWLEVCPIPSDFADAKSATTLADEPNEVADEPNDLPKKARKRRGEERREEEIRREERRGDSANGQAPFSERIFSEWNAAASRSKLKPAIRLTRKRSDALLALEQDRDFRSRWREAIERAERSPFCNGSKDWVMDFDSFVRKWPELLEGKYEDHEASKTSITDELEKRGAVK